ncbi:SRPBCC family protein [Streptomyces sp. NPDC059785]|uniref:SRPBCC family protein n=1 Tax=unclassified Streptomyces TaxID=2593676 RepID=UPI0036470FCC
MTLRAEGPASVDEVWGRYAAPSRWPSWSPQIRAVRVAVDRIAPGLRGEVVSLAGITASFVVEAVDEERRRWTWRVRLGPVRLRLHHEVGPRPREGGPDGTETSLRMEGPAPALLLYAGPARLALGRLVRD